MKRCFRIAFLMACAFPLATHANGLDIPEQGARSLARGGAFSARADDPTATIHNPGAVSKLRGTYILYSHNLVWNFSEFTRGESAIPATPGTEMFAAHEKRFGTVENETPLFPLGASLSATSDFGLKNMAFGLSVFGPNSSGHVTFPQDGGQRYLLTELDVLLIYYGATVAYGTDTWGVGATLQWVQVPFLDFSLVVDATFLPSLNPYASNFDVEATLRVKDNFSPSAVIGAWFRPVPAFEVAVSGRPFPIQVNLRGETDIEIIEGTLPDTAMLDLTVKNSSAALDLELPRTARLGMRYRHLQGKAEVFDLELDVVYEGWSSLNAYDTKLGGTVDLLGQAYDVGDVLVEKEWRDTLSVRLGGTWNVLPEQLSLSAGAFWEQAAAPDTHSHLDFPAGERLGGGAGVTYTMKLGTGSALDLSVTYSYTSQKDVTITEANGRVYQQRPLQPCADDANCGDSPGVVANAGTFKTHYQQLGLAVAYRFPVSKVQRQRPQERVKRPPTNQPDAKKVLREFE